MTCTEAALHHRDGYAFLFIPAGPTDILKFFSTKSDKHSVKDKQTLTFDSLFNNVKCVMFLPWTKQIDVRVVFDGISICSFLEACGVNTPAALLLPQLSAGTEVVDKWDPLQYELSSQECDSNS